MNMMQTHHSLPNEYASVFAILPYCSEEACRGLNEKNSTSTKIPNPCLYKYIIIIWYSTLFILMRKHFHRHNYSFFSIEQHYNIEYSNSDEQASLSVQQHCM